MFTVKSRCSACIPLTTAEFTLLPQTPLLHTLRCTAHSGGCSALVSQAVMTEQKRKKEALPGMTPGGMPAGLTM